MSNVRNRLDTAVTALLVICALGITGMAAWRTFGPPSGVAQATSAAQEETIASWSKYAKDGQPINVALAPKVTLLEFADFQCPFCARMAPTIAELARNHPHDLTIRFIQYPLSFHVHAMDAAIASECAAAQGRFVPFHDYVFAHPDSLGRQAWSDIARVSGVRDISGFESCQVGKDARTAVDRDKADGEQLHLPGTPALLINGTLITGLTPAEVRTRVEEALSGRRQSSAE